ncbi:MAG: hypothetical protein Q6352_017375 [Candidatus Freyrarchaeum guaymaensis]
MVASSQESELKKGDRRPPTNPNKNKNIPLKINFKKPYSGKNPALNPSIPPLSPPGRHQNRIKLNHVEDWKMKD